MTVLDLPPYFSTHTHSRYSSNDALPQVADMVKAGHALGYPALGLTDHGNPSGAVELYKACRKVGMEPLPGIELYVTPDRMHKIQGKQHLTINAISERGYRNLVHINNLTVRNFFYKPVIDMADFAQMSEDGALGGLVVGTGCYFGIVQTALRTQGPTEARQIVKALASWFPRVVIELHNHGVDKPDQTPEEEMTEGLLQIAHELGIPYIIASDAHYLYSQDQGAHDGLKELVSFSDDPSEGVFPGGPYCLLDNQMLKRYYEPEQIASSATALAELAERAHVRLPELESFSLKVPDVTFGKDPDEVLRQKVEEALRVRYPDGVPEQVRQRVEEELDVITVATMAGYLLLCWMVANFMRENGIWFHVRGSASGCYILYLLKVTQQDPLKWGLRLDRFMSKDRTRPPDVDFDVEHERRDEVIAMLEKFFYVRPVGNYRQYGLKEEDDPNGESDGKGSLLVKYHSVIGKKHGKGQSRDWNDIPRDDKALLLDLAARKLIAGMGKHAAGFIVAPDSVSISQLPLAMSSAQTKTMVTAYDKKAVEALGFCKLDLLGLKTKTAVRIACELIWARADYMQEDWNFANGMEFYEAIPDDDKETLQRIAKGDTEGTFQLSGWTMMRGCKDLKPKSTADIVAAQALYRPAILKAKLDQVYLKRRRKEQPLPNRHPDIMAVTKDTYGIALYQEQIIELCRVIGMGPEELTDTLDAVKASNAGTEEALVFLTKIKDRVGELATARGWNDLDVSWLVDGLAGYAEYSFNKAHSVAYGVEGYRTAYLAVHYPIEFWTGLLTAYSNSKKEVEHVRNARKYQIRIRAAHVNTSKERYTIDKDAVRRGLLSVKGVGPVAAAELAAKAPYVSLADLGQRVTPKKVSGAKGLALKKPPVECGGVIAALWDYGALEGLRNE